MMWNAFEKDRAMLELEFKESNWNDKTGVSAEELRRECLKIAQQQNKSRALCKAELVSYILRNARIEINPLGWFADKIDHGNLVLETRGIWLDEIKGSVMCDILAQNDDAVKSRAYDGNVDFGHSSPDWESILHLGLAGLTERLQNAMNTLEDMGKLTDERREFFETSQMVYRALTDYIFRMAEEAERLAEISPKMAIVSQSLRSIAKGAPSTMLEAMQLTSIFYFVQTYVEGDFIRTIGGIDRLYYRFYLADIESGKFTREQIAELLQYFMFHFYAADIIANLPFALCGLDENGDDVTNELSYLILEVYGKLNVISPKIHVRVNSKTPEDFLRRVIRIIKSGNNSFVFANDDIIIKALMKQGQTLEEARNYVLIGCYEPAALGKEVPCSCNGRINLVKAVEYAMTNGVDLKNGKQTGTASGNPSGLVDFEAFCGAVRAQIAFFSERSLELISEYERYYMQINPSPLFSATMLECVQSGTDVYAGGAKYNNSSMYVLGLADAADSIYAVKRVVYDEKKFSLTEFSEILRNNWKGSEVLRLTLRNKLPKYGNNESGPDEIASWLMDFTAGTINRKPNGRNGIFRCGFYSIDWNVPFGKGTPASASGRAAGEVLSKNITSAAYAGKTGVTGLINTAIKLDYTNLPNGTVLDVVLHPSSVSGSAGDTAMLALIKTYFDGGGMTVHFNIFDPKVLREAQKHPEQYATLQVRLCGWNVYFVDLKKVDQDEFIERAERAL